MACGRYEITRKNDGEYTFSLYSTGGRLIALGGTYKTVTLAKKGIASLRINSSAELVDLSADIGERDGKKLPCPRVEIHTEKNGGGGYNFAVFAKNGVAIAFGEGFGTRSRCLETVSDLKYVAFSAETYVI